MGTATCDGKYGREESLREENRKAHEEDERFRMTAVKAAGQVRQRAALRDRGVDRPVVASSCCPSGIFLTLMTVETLGQERMLLDLTAGGRLGADLVSQVVARSMPDMLPHRRRPSSGAAYQFYLRILARGVERFFPHGTGLVYLPRKRGGCSLSSKRSHAGIPSVAPDTRRTG